MSRRRHEVGKPVVSRCFYSIITQKFDCYEISACGMLLEDHTEQVRHVFRVGNNKALKEIPDEVFTPNERDFDKLAKLSHSLLNAIYENFVGNSRVDEKRPPYILQTEHLVDCVANLEDYIGYAYMDDTYAAGLEEDEYSIYKV